MFHPYLSITRDRFVSVYSIVLVLIIGCMGAIPLSWGTPVDSTSPRIKIKPPTPTLEDLSDYLRKGQFPAVIEGSRQLLKDEPEAEIYGLLSVALAGVDQFDKASEAIQQAKSANEPNHRFFAHVSQAISLQTRQKYDGAITECRQAIKLDPKHPLAYTFLGLAYFGKKEHEKADDTTYCIKIQTNSSVMPLWSVRSNDRVIE